MRDSYMKSTIRTLMHLEQYFIYRKAVVQIADYMPEEHQAMLSTWCYQTGSKKKISRRKWCAAYFVGEALIQLLFTLVIEFQKLSSELCLIAPYSLRFYRKH